MPTQSTVTLNAIIGSTTYNLSDGSLTWRILDDNLASPDLHILSERGPLQDGASDLGFRYDPRVFTIQLLANANSAAALYSKRQQLINIFKRSAPSTPLKLRFDLPDGSSRQIDCQIIGRLKMDASDRVGLFAQNVFATLWAGDPMFYDPAPVTTNFGIAGGGSTMNVPLVVPWNIGSSTLNQTLTVPYLGNFKSNPVIRITGPITNPVITNLMTGEKLDFTGITIPAGTTYIIDTRYGYKTVVDQTGANQINKLTSDSNLTSFHLEVDPLAGGGLNSIRATGTVVNAATTVYMIYYNRYLGI